MSDHPFDECVTEATILIGGGVTVYQKFTCANCGSRQTMDVPDKFYVTGKCEECKHITNIRAQGCNYLVDAKGPDAQSFLLARMASGKIGSGKP